MKHEQIKTVLLFFRKLRGSNIELQKAEKWKCIVHWIDSFFEQLSFILLFHFFFNFSIYSSLVFGVDLLRFSNADFYCRKDCLSFAFDIKKTCL